MRTTLLALAASTLLACGGHDVDHSGDIYYDPCDAIVIQPSEATTALQHQSIKAAIALWRDVGVTTLTLDSQPGGQRVPIHFADAIVLHHGVYDPSKGEVHVNSKMMDHALDVTIAHELGHAIGLPHVLIQERGSVMNPGNSTVTPTPDDERQLRERWSCLSSSK